MSSADFKELALPLINKKDANLLNKLSLNTDYFKTTGCNFIDSWQEWEKILRINLAKQRMIKYKKENVQVPEPPAKYVETVTIASKAVDEFSPLEGEIILDKARWNMIDSLTGSKYYFDRSNVFAYFLKLLLQERRQSFNTEKGFAEYKSLYNSIVESAQNSRGEHT